MVAIAIVTSFCNPLVETSKLTCCNLVISLIKRVNCKKVDFQVFGWYDYIGNAFLGNDERDMHLK